MTRSPSPSSPKHRRQLSGLRSTEPLNGVRLALTASSHIPIRGLPPNVRQLLKDVADEDFQHGEKARYLVDSYRLKIQETKLQLCGFEAEERTEVATISSLQTQMRALESQQIALKTDVKAAKQHLEVARTGAAACGELLRLYEKALFKATMESCRKVAHRSINRRETPLRSCPSQSLRADTDSGRNSCAISNCRQHPLLILHYTWDHDHVSTKVVIITTMEGRRQHDGEKERAILRAVEQRDIDSLRDHCLTTGGLLHDGLRQQAWPLLVDSSDHDEPLPRILSTKDEQCVQWDVKRWIGQKSELLVQVIERSCRFYYQGYHQVASVMLKTMQDTELSAQVLQRLYDTHLGKFVSATDLPLSRFLQWMVLPTIWFLDDELHGILAEQEPTFCAPWILTWFSSLEEPRMFDAFIAAHPLLPFYCSMVLVLEHKEQILQDAMTVHKPLQVDDSEKLLTESLQLMGRLPPHKLWVIASHFHGDGEVKELLRDGPMADALLTLAAPERPSLVPASPLSQIAFGLGRPRKKRYRRRILLGCVACMVFFLALLYSSHSTQSAVEEVQDEKAVQPSTAQQNRRAPTCLRRDIFSTTATGRSQGVCPI